MEIQKQGLDYLVGGSSKQETVTMNSREITEVIKNLPNVKEKRHANICRDIKKQLEEQGINQLNFESVYLDSKNEQRTCYELDYEQTMILVSGYSIPIRAAIVKRLAELEKQLQKQAPTTYIDALKALVVAEEAKEKLQLHSNIQDQRIGRLVHNSRSYTTTEIAKELGFTSASAFNNELKERGIIYKDTRGVWLLYSEYASKGFMVIKQKEFIHKTTGKSDVRYYSVWTGLGRDYLVGIFSGGALE